MNKIIILGICTLLLALTGCELESRTLNTADIKICDDYCLGKGMTNSDFTGSQGFYVKCLCYTILEKGG